MIIPLHKAVNTYEEIVKRLKKSNGKVIIFVGFDLDSLCTLRILVFLLRTDQARYEIVPVMNYDQLDKKLEELKLYYEDPFNNQDIKALVMINCGGTRDMSKKWFNDETCNLPLLLLDVHRPSHHNNVHSKNTILIIDDSYYESDICPTEEDVLEINNSHAQEDEEDEENKTESEAFKEGEEDEENEPDNTTNRRIKKKKDDLDTIVEENEDEVDKLVESVRIKKSMKSAEEIEKKVNRRIREKKRMNTRNYYSGNYFGFPSAYILYKIASAKSLENNQLLWLLIVALTGHYLQAHIDQQQYDTLYKECSLDALKLNSGGEADNTYQRQMKKDTGEEEVNLDKNDFSDVKAKTINKDKSTIMVESDYRLYLYKHWNLFESLTNSPYTMAHLNTWRESGREDIKKLLTIVGVPIEEAKQNYTFMKNESKETFKQKIMEVSRRFDLKELIFHSFVFQFDQKTQLTASDYVHCVTVLLDYPLNFKKVEGSDEYLEDLPLEEIVDPDLEEEEKQLRLQYKFENFWACYDFLSFKNPAILKQVINLAINFNTLIMQQSVTILINKLVRTNSSFRFASVPQIGDGYMRFANPLSLEKLALFVQYAQHQRSDTKKSEPKPLLLAIKNELTKTHIVAGVIGNVKEQGEKNQFAIRFRLAANKIGAEVKLDSFNDCIIEVKDEDYYNFYKELTEYSVK